MSEEEDKPQTKKRFLRSLQKEFFCVMRQRKLMRIECLDLFCFSNALSCSQPEKFGPFDPCCKECPEGKRLRQEIATINLSDFSKAKAERVWAKQKPKRRNNPTQK